MTSNLIVTAHRNDHGPFTLAGNILRSLQAELVTNHHDLLQLYDIEVLTVAPEFAPQVNNLRETQTSSIAPQVRTRYYPPAWMTRIGHGVTELIIELSRRGVLHRVTVTHAEEADPTDVELLSILQRRSSESLEIVIIDGPVTPTGSTPDSQGDAAARAYVDGDCTSTDVRAHRAYQRLTPEARRALHEKRSAEIRRRIAAGEISLARWTLPLHAEQGNDPDRDGVAALTNAIELCVLAGFYDAVVELGNRLLPALPAVATEERWLVTAKLTLALSALGRVDDAEAAYDQACASTTQPSTHLQSYYGRAMLMTRFAEPNLRDHRRAKALVNTAITIASLLPKHSRRAFNTTFSENGLALVEMHLGNLAESLRLVETGIERLNNADDHDRDTQHRWVLEHNRAQLLAAMGRPEESLAGYDLLVSVDPHHSEYHHDRAGVLRRLGRLHEADDELTEAIRLSPPYPEPVYNRADLRASVDDVDGAIHDFRYVLQLDPTFPSAHVNLADLLLDRGEPTASRQVAREGLMTTPHDPALLTAQAQANQQLGEVDNARTGYDAALAADPDYLPALAGRATIAFDIGTIDSLNNAVADLERAVHLSGDPDLHDNLALACERRAALRQTPAPTILQGV